MKRKEFVVSILKDAVMGEETPLKGFILYLTQDCNVSTERIVHIARKHFGIPANVSLSTLDALLPESIQ